MVSYIYPNIALKSQITSMMPIPQRNNLSKTSPQPTPPVTAPATAPAPASPWSEDAAPQIAPIIMAMINKTTHIYYNKHYFAVATPMRRLIKRKCGAVRLSDDRHLAWPEHK